MQIRSEGLADILAPAVRALHHDWAVYVAVPVTTVVVLVEAASPLLRRGEIVQFVTPVYLTVIVGALVAVGAMIAIFASLSTPKFIKIVQGYDYLISFLMLTGFALLIVLLLGLIILAASYVSWIVMTKYYFAFIAVGQFLVFFSLFQMLDAFRIIAVQMVAASRETREGGHDA